MSSHSLAPSCIALPWLLNSVVFAFLKFLTDIQNLQRCVEYNVSQLHDSVVQRQDGWRLLTVHEVETKPTGKEANVEMWMGDRWAPDSRFVPGWPKAFRTKLTPWCLEKQRETGSAMVEEVRVWDNAPGGKRPRLPAKVQTPKRLAR